MILHRLNGKTGSLVGHGDQQTRQNDAQRRQQRADGDGAHAPSGLFGIFGHKKGLLTKMWEEVGERVCDCSAHGVPYSATADAKMASRSKLLRPAATSHPTGT